MYEESGAGFDPTSLHEGLLVHHQAEDGFSQTQVPNCNNNNNNQSFSSIEESSNNYPQNIVATAALEMEQLQHQINLEIEQCNYNNGNHDQVHEIAHHDSSNWQEMAGFSGGIVDNNHFAHHDHVQNGHFNATGPLPDGPQYVNPDLLTMFPLPRCSSSSLTFSNSPSSSAAHKSSQSFLASLGLLGEISNNPTGEGASGGGVVYDPLLPLNLPPQPPLFRELFHSLPHGGYAIGGPRIGGSLFGGGGMDEGDHHNHHVNVGSYQIGDGGVFEFTAGEMDFNGKSRDGKDTKHFATEKHRRVLLNDKYNALRALVPNPTKNDRASVVGDAIDYINELKRTVAELKVLVEQKRCIRERLKRPKTEDGGIDGNESKSVGDMDNPYNGSSLRSSWLHRKSKNTDVDIRIVDDEVTIKLVQQKRVNCLLFVSKVLDELQLDLHHVAGGLIGDYYSFLFNSKICEGSIVYASAIANRLIEVVDKQYAALLPTTSY